MKIMLLADNQGKGGAGIAAMRLADALRAAEHDVCWAAGRIDSACDEPTVCYQHLADRTSRMAYRLSHGPRRLSPRIGLAIDQHLWERQIDRAIARWQPDVVNVHGIHGVAMDPTLPMRLSRRVPVVWTLHDMWAFTGGCAYDMGCDAFTTRCHGDCPQAAVYPTIEKQQVPRQFDRRRAATAHAGRLAIATPSRWLARQAGRGMFAELQTRVIANCVQTHVYQPTPRAEARERLDLPDDRPIVLGPSPGSEARKGGALLREALGRLKAPVTWVSLGGDESGGGMPEHVRHLPLGQIDDPQLIAAVYNAADVFALPTQADNLPNTLLEACACGTPSVATDVGGISDAVRPGVTGWLVAADDVAELAQAIGQATSLGDHKSATLRTMCRQFALEHFTPHIQASRYAELFHDMTHSTTNATDHTKRTTTARENKHAA